VTTAASFDAIAGFARMLVPRAEFLVNFVNRA